MLPSILYANPSCPCPPSELPIQLPGHPAPFAPAPPPYTVPIPEQFIADAVPYIFGAPLLPNPVLLPPLANNCILPLTNEDTEPVV